MFPPDKLVPRALVNRPGIIYDADKLSNLYVEDFLDLCTHIDEIEQYILDHPGGGGGTPGGSDGQIQFNDATDFGGCPAITYDKSTKKASIQNTVIQLSGVNNALEFFKSPDYLSYVDCGADTSIPDGSAAFSIGVWVKWKNIGGHYTVIIMRTTSGAWSDGWGLWQSGSSLYFFNRSYNVGVGFSPIAVDGNWHLIVATYDGYTTSIFYDNVAGTTLHTTPLPTSASLKFGDGGGGNNFLNAILDEAFLYDHALSTGEMDALWDSGTGHYHDGTETGLISVWHMDETAGTSAADSKGVNTGTLYNFTKPACWVSGYIVGSSTEQDVNTVIIEDSTDPSERGVQKFSDPNSRTRLQGSTLEIVSGGVTYTFDSATGTFHT